MARRLHLPARQPAVGAHEAPGAGVLRSPRPRDRHSPQRRGPQATDQGTRHRGPAAARGVPRREATRRRAPATCLRNSGRYPLNGRGDVNTYAVFAELFRTLTDPRGRAGVIVPTGIATDATTQYFFKDLVTTGSLAALYDFENAAPIFDGVHSQLQVLPAHHGRAQQPRTRRQLRVLPARPRRASTSARFALTPDEITLLNPNTGTCPVFRTRRDAEITLGIYRRVPVLINEAKVAAGDPDGNPWGVSFMQACST